MFLLDTNVVSELVKRIPDARVLARLNSDSPDTLFLSAVSVSALAKMPAVANYCARRADCD